MYFNHRAHQSKGRRIPLVQSGEEESRGKYPDFFNYKDHVPVLNEIFRCTDFSAQPHRLYEDLPYAIPYKKATSMETAKTTKHVGQLKLQMSEIEFLTDVLETNTQQAVFVYAGSAPSNHLPKVMELFPNVKFLLVDPHEHDLHWELPVGKTGCTWISHLDSEFEEQKVGKDKQIDENETKLVDENETKRINKTGQINETNPVTDHTLPSGNNRIIYFKHGEFIKQRAINLVVAGELKEVLKSDELAAKSIEDYDEVMNYLIASQYRCFIIEDLFTDELAEAISKAIESNKNIPFYFCSDIRTSSNPYSVGLADLGKKPIADPSPGDLDVLWNLAQQYIWLKIMHVKAAMLKFRVPYYNKVENIDDIPNYQKETFKKARKMGIDFLSNYKARKLIYFSRKCIYLQAFPEIYSAETRYIVQNFDKTEEINMTEYENKLYYYNNFERAILFHQHCCLDRTIGIDGCGDCALMVFIYERFYSKFYSAEMNYEKRCKEIKKQIQSSLCIMQRRLCGKKETHGRFFAPFYKPDDIINFGKNM